MDYQEILCYPYVINLINVLIKEKQKNKQYKIDILKLENKFYIKDDNDKLYLIKEEMSNKELFPTDTNLLLSILDTCVHFEIYKEKPLDSYLYQIELSETIDYFSKKNINIDKELLKQLQFQYITNKSYFDN